LTLATVVALTCGLLSSVAGAQSQASVSSETSLRDRIDAAAQRWFTAQNDAAEIDREIAQLEHEVRVLGKRLQEIRARATEQAVDLYTGSATNTIMGVLSAEDALGSVRRAELIGSAQERANEILDALEARTDELAAKRDALRVRRGEQGQVLERLDRERADLERRLDALRASRRTSRAGGPDDEPAAPAERAGAPSAVAAVSAPPTNTSPEPPPAVTAPPPATGGVHPHHDDPFLVCTRMRESGGNYGVVSASGLYYGAYQFSPLTWDTTAAHAGRSELVGTLPSRASEYDQDDMAWTLYRWQGNAPWGGRC
jgi:peptidoglycan hydrolase CwlO-like protein